MLIFSESLSAEGDRLIQTDAFADDRGFPDNHAGTVIDKKVAIDVGGRSMSIAVVDGDIGGKARGSVRTQLIEGVCETIVDDGGHAGIAEQNFRGAGGSRIALIGCL